MRKRDALKLHNGDEVIIKDTGEPAIVLNVYEKDGHVIVETDFHVFTSFYSDELS